MYILMVNIHGLVRAENIEFGRDADTGGQTRYVIDLVKHLSKQPEVDRIDLVTRRIKDKRVAPIYNKPIESISEKARIVRLPCGGSKYLKKEKLWPYVDEFTDQIIGYLRTQSRLPDIIHGHYADSGYIASQLTSIFGIPLIFTGHSLGRIKLSFLLDSGLPRDKINKDFAMNTRIENEEKIMAASDLIIASTAYEKDELYGKYNNKNLPRYVVIPPGLDLESFFPYYEYELPGSLVTDVNKQAHFKVVNELKRFHFEPEKPLILSLCRPDARKNIDLLIQVFGEDKELQAMANLAIFAGIRDDITKMEEGERKVLGDILLSMDKYDLYGKMAIPKHHDPAYEVPELYRVAALKKGVFVSAAFVETFGLTFIESAATGLPFIATHQGGPVDIVKNTGAGILVDIQKPALIARAIKKVLTDASKWNTLSEKGINNVREVYTWDYHCRKYLECINERIASFKKDLPVAQEPIDIIGKRMMQSEYLLISDIDDTLLGDIKAVRRLLEFLEKNKERISFGIATGRDPQSTRKILEEYGVKAVDIVITSVGSEIYYQHFTKQDTGWMAHIGRDWKPERIREALRDLPFLTPQDNPSAQRDYKISYDLSENASWGEAIPLIHDQLMKNRLSYNLLFSHGVYVDILPQRASKGKAIRYLSHKWKIPMENIITAGNSGNDLDMLNGTMSGIVVSNYEPELEILRKNQRVYFASSSYADGTLEGLKHFIK